MWFVGFCLFVGPASYSLHGFGMLSRILMSMSFREVTELRVWEQEREDRQHSYTLVTQALQQQDPNQIKLWSRVELY